MRLAPLWWVVAASCAGPDVRGALVVAAGEEPPGTVRASYVPSDCQDASGGPVQYRGRLFLVVTNDHVRRLVEARRGYDSLVMVNVFEERGELVFQSIVGATLREVRLRRDASWAGQLAVASRWDEKPSSGSRFQALAYDRVLTCRLRPELYKARAPVHTPDR